MKRHRSRSIKENDMGVCQIIVTALYMMSLGLYLAKDGKPKEGKYNFLEALIMTIIILVLLWKGGFYS